MSHFVSRKSNSQQLLMQLISDDKFIREIQSLEPQIVRRIIKHVGLEDASELLPLLSSEQLQEVMDQDTWLRTMPGEEDKFDAKRFSTWLAMLLESGPEFAADRVYEMDEELFTLALSEIIIALDVDEMNILGIKASNESETEFKYLDKVLESTFTMEIEGYMVMSKDSFHWDTIVDLLTALAKKHPDLVERTLLRVSRITLELIDEADGLINLLRDSEMLELDVTYDRQERRENEGYVGPSAAKAFLKLVENTSEEGLLQETEQDHLTKMYFRGLKVGKIVQRSPLSSEMLLLLESHGIKINDNLSQTKRLTSDKRISMVQLHLQELQTSDPELFKKKLSDLNYLANVLVSGYNSENKMKRFLRPLEAMELALEFCDLGFDRSTDLIKAFKLGWKTKQKKTPG